MRKGIGLIAGMVVFAVAILSLLGWLMFGDVAGRQRGLVFRNMSGSDVVLQLDDEPPTPFAPDAVRTIAVKRGEFPQEFVVSDASGTPLYRRQFVFDELQDYAFYIGLGREQFVLYTDPGGE